MPFAHHAGLVARGLEGLGEGDGVVWDAAGPACAGAAKFDAAGIAAGDELGARGHAGGRGVKRGEAQALGGHAVEAGRLDGGVAEATEVAVADVVGVKQDDVGLFGGGACLGRGRAEKSEERQRGGCRPRAERVDMHGFNSFFVAECLGHVSML